MKRFWVSWHQPTEDERPLTFPPNAAILGWWCSGYTADEKHILCALVQAESASEMQRAILTDWPEACEWRFLREVHADFAPGDRFPFSDWMKERFGVSR